MLDRTAHDRADHFIAHVASSAGEEEQGACRNRSWVVELLIRHPERRARDLGGWKARSARHTPAQVPRLTLGMTRWYPRHPTLTLTVTSVSFSFTFGAVVGEPMLCLACSAVM